MSHTAFVQLVDMVEDRLPPPDRDKVQAHLDTGCDKCNSTRNWLERFHDRVETDVTPDPPEWLVRRSMVMFKRMPVLARPQRPGRLVASLVYDSLGAPLPGGLRGDNPDRVRSQLYRAGLYDIDLQFRRGDEGEGRRARGQVLSRGEPLEEGVRIEIHDPDGLIETTHTDRLGEFAFLDVPTGLFDVHIDSEEGQKILLVGVDPSFSKDPRTN